MTKAPTPFDEVYGARDADAQRATYDGWADGYDTDLARAEYATPQRVAQALAAQMADPAAPVLDFGCGTGLSGNALAASGLTTIDGVDVSSPMLAKAADKGVYRRLTQIAPGDAIPRGYSAIAAIGAIGSGAAPPEALETVFAALSPDALFALSLNDHALADPAYTGRLASARDDGRFEMLFEEYGPHLPALAMGATVYVFRRR